MAPKQPDWAFLESLTPDDLEEDDTEKVIITVIVSITSINKISITIFCNILTCIIIITTRCTSSSPPGILETKLTSEQLLPSCLSRSVAPIYHCLQLIRLKHKACLGLDFRRLWNAKD